MKYDFDQIISRKETYSTKWLKFSDDDVIPMWIADMDFICPPEITSAMSERIAQGIFGYSEIPSNLTEVFVNNVKNNSGWSIEKDCYCWEELFAECIPIRALVLAGLPTTNIFASDLASSPMADP